MPVNAGLMSSARGDWRTPAELLGRICAFNGGAIELDPCTDASNPTGARSFYTPADNGLDLSWNGSGLCFVNPPYGREIGPWVAKAARAGMVREVILLVPARTDALWFQTWVTLAPAVCFLRGRLKFQADGHTLNPAPFPSVLAYWGSRPDVFRDHFGSLGWIP